MKKGEKKYLTVYRASAGSGKTYTLALEYIARLLASPQPIHGRMLAMTFTNKATAEMRGRILQNLYDVAEGIDVEFVKALRERSYYAEELSRIELAELRRRARAALYAVVHDYDHFYVETIDKFFQYLLSTLARELGLSASYRVDIHDAEVVDRAVDSLLIRLNDEDVRGMERSRRLRTARWVRDYVSERVDEGSGWRMADDLKIFGRRNAMHEAFLLHKKALLDVLFDEKRVAELRKEIAILWRMYGPDGDERTNLQRRSDELVADYDALDRKKLDRNNRFLRAFFERGTSLPEDLLNGKPGASVRGYLELPMSLVKEEERADAKLCRAVERMMEKARRYWQEGRKMAEIIETCRIFMGNMNPLRLLGEISREMDDINAEHNRVMLSGTKMLLSRMVEGTDAPFVFEKAGNRFRHIMIDEFQDTARTQWNNIHKLLLENASAGDSCLIVGDVKQSIYRFNGGDWGILQHIEEETGLGIHTEPLSDNYRSEEAIIMFNNALFPAMAMYYDAMGDTVSIGNMYSPERVWQGLTKERGGGYVRLCVGGKGNGSPLGGSDVSDTNSLYNQIRQLHEIGVPYGEMAILVRTKQEGRRIINHFERNGLEIPFVSEEAAFLGNSPAVGLLIETLRYLYSLHCHEEDSLVKVDTIARTYIAWFYQNEVLHRQLDAAVIAEGGATLLPMELQDEWRVLYEMPLYELCGQLIETFGLNRDNPNGAMAGQLPYLMSFLDEVLAFLEEEPSDIGVFLSMWDSVVCQRSIPGSEPDGVQILTVHKSKGLAFHTVFVPFCWEIEKSRRSTGNYLWCEPNQQPFDTLEIFPVPLTRKTNYTIFNKDYESEIFQRRVESLNLAYVAFTRPKSNLLIWAEETWNGKEPHDMAMGDVLGKTMREKFQLQAESSLSLRITDPTEGANYTVYELGAPFVSHGVADKKKHTDNPFIYEAERMGVGMTVSNRIVRFRQSSESVRFLNSLGGEEALQQQYIKKGNIYHEVLSQIRQVADLPRAIRFLVQKGIVLPEQTAEIHKFIYLRITHPKVKHWFDGTWQVFNERSFASCMSDGTTSIVRADRVMVRGKEAMVVDYKFGNPRSEYKGQVVEYADRLCRLGYSPVRAYLWYVYNNEIVPVLVNKKLGDK